MSIMQLRILFIVICILIVSVNLSEGAKPRGGRRRSKIKTPGSPRFIFYTHPRRREYYDNPNGAQITKASHFDYEFFLGHKIVFICVAKGEPRPRITWFKDGIELHAHPFLQISETPVYTNQTKSKLEITPARQMDSGTYDCEANNKYAIDIRSFKADFASPSD